MTSEKIHNLIEKETLHILSGDCAGDCLKSSGISGDILIWHDLLYEGIRHCAWPDRSDIQDRAQFISDYTGGGLKPETIVLDLVQQYEKLEKAFSYKLILLWFDQCLFDLSMLAHILSCLRTLSEINTKNNTIIKLICPAHFEGIEPFNGLGQLNPEQLLLLLDTASDVTDEQFEYSIEVEKAFSSQDLNAFEKLASEVNPAIPGMPIAFRRWLQEQPDAETGLGWLEKTALEAVKQGKTKPGEIFRYVAEADEPPQYWGDTTLWKKINSLADRKPPLLKVVGPEARMPEWLSKYPLSEYQILIP